MDLSPSGPCLAGLVTPLMTLAVSAPSVWGQPLFGSALLDLVEGHRFEDQSGDEIATAQGRQAEGAAVIGDSEQAAAQAPDSAGWLQLSAGLDIVQRKFTLTSADAGIQYDSGFYPGLEGALELYPLRLFSPGRLDGLGVRMRVARYFVDTTLLRDDQAPSLDVPTRHKEWGLSILYRERFGAFEVVGSIGFESLAFTLGDNAIYQSSQYAGLALGLGGWFAAVAERLRMGINIEVRPAPSLGDSEQSAFGDASGFGFAFGAGVELSPLERFSIRGFYRFRQYATTFAGSEHSDLNGPLDGTDQFHGLGVRLGISY